MTHKKIKKKLAQLSNEEIIEILSQYLLPNNVVWVVNNFGELGVKIGCRYFFLNKGSSSEYTQKQYKEDWEPDMDLPETLRVRRVGKREFGEVCIPRKWDGCGEYTKELRNNPPSMPLEEADKWHDI